MRGFTQQQIAIKDLEDKLIPYNFVPNSNLIRIFPNTKNEIGNTFIITLNNEATSIIKEITIMHDVEANPQESYTSYKIKIRSSSQSRIGNYKRNLYHKNLVFLNLLNF